jgi:FdhE protein
LRDEYPPAAEILRFYEKVLGFQRTVALQSQYAVDAARPLAEQIDLPGACRHMTALLSLATVDGTEVLRQAARRLLQADEGARAQLLQAALRESTLAPDSVDGFFPLACLQPILENLQFQLPEMADHAAGRCPACGSLPLLAVLRGEAKGASRWLQCSFCLHQWLFRRVLCPWCGEGSHEKLVRFSADDYPHVRGEACDTCKRYLKSIDLTADGRAVPLIDEVASGALDLWAVEQGYSKIARDIMGL